MMMQLFGMCELCDGKTGQRKAVGQARDASFGERGRERGAAREKESSAAIREKISASVAVRGFNTARRQDAAQKNGGTGKNE